MNQYICHCTAEMFDKWFNDNVISRPTIFVKATDENNALEVAKQHFIIKELQGRTLLSFKVEVIKDIT